MEVDFYRFRAGFYLDDGSRRAYERRYLGRAERCLEPSIHHHHVVARGHSDRSEEEIQRI
ncbi:MAG: hypothetical protein ISP41_17990 [Alphaproteobacteria bacterium]|nr:hypothetical protein [Alphaproteobacteria bacterium]